MLLNIFRLFAINVSFLLAIGHCLPVARVDEVKNAYRNNFIKQYSPFNSDIIFTFCVLLLVRTITIENTTMALFALLQTRSIDDASL